MAAPIITFYKIFQKQNANGISESSYFIAFVTGVTLVLFSDSQDVKLIFTIELLFSFIGFILVKIFHHKNNYKYKEKLKHYITPLIFAFGGVFGVSQAMKTYRIKRQYYSNISLPAYIMFFIVNGISIYKETSVFAIGALFIGMVLFVYIILETILSNKQFKSLRL